MRWTSRRRAVDDLAPPLRITIFSLNYWPETTGIGPYAHSLATGLQSRGYDVRVVTSYPHYPEWRVRPGYRRLVHREKVEGIPVERVRHYVPRHPSRLKRAASEVTFGLRLAMTPWRSPDVAIFMSPAMLGSAVALATRGIGRRRAAVGVIVQDLYSTGVRELGGNGGSLIGLIGRAERALLGCADGIVVIHERFRQPVGEMGVGQGTVRVIRNWSKSPPGVDAVDRVAGRAKLGWREDDVVVLHAGAMGVKQGLENVIEAARLADRASLPIRFILAGQGSRRESLETVARGLSAVEFIDALPEADFQVALRCADFLLINELPDLQETAVPSKLTSYLASGTPVIAAVRPGSVTESEVLASGGGICVPAGSPDDLLSAVLGLSTDPEARADLGARGLAYCTSVLSEETAMRSYSEWVYELASRRR